MRRFSNTTQVTTLGVVLILLFVVFSLASPVFLTANNLINVARQVSFLGIAAVGASMVLLIGGLDLSVGSTLALTGVAAAKMIVEAKSPMSACWSG
jgi:ribose/xylose/arabinose/galactoside ABC-type transport system permease subunit